VPHGIFAMRDRDPLRETHRNRPGFDGPRKAAHGSIILQEVAQPFRHLSPTKSAKRARRPQLAPCGGRLGAEGGPNFGGVVSGGWFAEGGVGEEHPEG
jgi:hypothetical protein